MSPVIPSPSVDPTGDLDYAPEEDEFDDDDGLAIADDDTSLPEVTVEEAPPPPLGRSWAFDFGSETFIRGGTGPLETRGVATLVLWIDKCLRTARGALTIHPDGYGMERPDAEIGIPVRELNIGELERRITQALTFHPRIADVVDFQIVSADPDDDAATVEYTVLTDPPLDDLAPLTLRTRLES